MATFSANDVSIDTTGMVLGNAAANMVANSTTLAISSGLNLIDRTSGTNIGTLTDVGGIAAAFDGNYDQSSYACAVRTNASRAHVGKTLAVSSVISKAVTYASNNVGYVSCDEVELRLYAKTGAAPANGIDGTLLANVYLVDINGNTNPVTLASNNLITQWAHAWVTIVPNTSTNVSIRIGELELYGAPSNSTLITANGIIATGLNVNGVTSYSFSTQILSANAGTFYTVNTNTLTSNAIVANGSVGTNNQVLTSNGSTTFWGQGSVNINSLTEKTTLVSDDLFLIEDSEASNAKKKLKGSTIAPYIFQNMATDQTGTNVATAQSWFPSAAADAVTVTGNTTYRFAGLLSISRSAGATSHTTSVAFAGTATVASIRGSCRCKTGDTTALAGLSAAAIDSTSALVIKAASTATTEQIMLTVEGTVRFSTGGTFIPQFQYSVAPGGVPTVKSNSFFEMAPIGTDLVQSAGTWS